jgi:Flp pilus assembly protein TadB
MAVDTLTLTELQAALRAGAGAAEAVAATTGDGVLDGVARQARLGRSLADIATSVDTGDAAADFLVRSLALAERCGAGAAEAVAHALTDIREEARLRRLIEVRTTQARGTAVVLAGMPVVIWALLVVLDRRTPAFYATPIGWVTGGVAALLAVVAWRWMRRLIRSTPHAALAADPLAPEQPPVPWRKAAAVALPVAAAGAVVSPAVGALAAAVVAAGVARGGGRRTGPKPGGGGAETVALVAVALDAGLPPPTALAEVARLAPEAAQPLLARGAARVQGGWTCEEAFAGTALAPLGQTLAAAQRWGAPAAPALRDLAAELRERRRAAVEAAAERLQLVLIFPTTLLTLPAFILAVVPPLLWSTLRG